MATMERPKPKQETQPVAPKKKSAEEAVEELEKRLASLGGPSAPAATDEDALGFAKPAAPPAPLVEPKTDVKGGKNALLARIMAAQNKAKETAPPPPIDLLGPPPPISQAPPPPQMAPPPAYDAGLLLGPPPTQQQAPPPSFDAIEDNIMMAQPPPQYTASAPAASAPSFEDLDLLGGQSFVPAPPPQQFVPAPPPPEEEIIMGMEGLSDGERHALMEEQRKIMEQIEREKNANASAIASAQADNFDMRSTSNAVNAISGGRSSRTETGNKVNLGGGQEVALHGPERTKEAIKDEEAMQMEADRKLAESLQSEEYEQAEQRPRRQTRQQPTRQPQRQEESWWDTVTNMFSGETSTEDQPSPAERQSGANSSSSGGGGRPGARVAQSQPLFSCVVDSVNSTVGTLTGTQLGQDAEGNVHGVDSSSLLAVSNVGRDTEYSRFDNN